PQPAHELPPAAALPDAPAQPDIPPPLPVAEPLPAIAFALPVAGPVRVTSVRQASSSRALSAMGTAHPVPQTLTFGEGEGRQPAPDYPARARREGQEGAVTVRFTVGADGHV